MDPMPEEKQSGESQQKQSNEGAIRGFTNPLGKIGSRVAAQTALRGLTAFLGSASGVWVPIAIAIVLVFVLTFIIVGFGGAPPSEMNVQAPQASSTLAPTLSPVAP